MFGSLFGRRKKKRRSDDASSPGDETIRSARVGDVVVITGFSPTLEDAYFITEKLNRYESPLGKWYDLIGVEGERRVAIEWSDDDGLSIFCYRTGRASGTGQRRGSATTSSSVWTRSNP